MLNHRSYFLKPAPLSARPSRRSAPQDEQNLRDALRLTARAPQDERNPKQCIQLICGILLAVLITTSALPAADDQLMLVPYAGNGHAMIPHERGAKRRRSPSPAPRHAYANALNPARRARYAAPELDPLPPLPPAIATDTVFTAVYYGDTDALQRAINSKKTLTTMTAWGTPLHQACRADNHPEVTAGRTACGLMLIDHFKTNDARPVIYNTTLKDTKTTPLMEAAEHNNLPLVCALLATQKINPNLTNNAGIKAHELSTDTAVQEIFGAVNEDKDFASVMQRRSAELRKPEPPEDPDTWYNHPLALLLARDFDELIPLNWRYNEPLTELVIRGEPLDHIQKLLNAGISPTDGMTVPDGSPLFFACCNNDTATALLLLDAERKLPPQRQSCNRRFNMYHIAELSRWDNPHTCLMVAVAYDNLALAQALIDAGAQLDLTNRSGETAAMLAKKLNRYEITRILSGIRTRRETQAAARAAQAAVEASTDAPSLLDRTQGTLASWLPWNW